MEESEREIKSLRESFVHVEGCHFRVYFSPLASLMGTTARSMEMGKECLCDECRTSLDDKRKTIVFLVGSNNTVEIEADRSMLSSRSSVFKKKIEECIEEQEKGVGVQEKAETAKSTTTGEKRNKSTVKGKEKMQEKAETAKSSTLGEESLERNKSTVNGKEKMQENAEVSESSTTMGGERNKSTVKGKEKMHVIEGRKKVKEEEGHKKVKAIMDDEKCNVRHCQKENFRIKIIMSDITSSCLEAMLVFFDRDWLKFSKSVTRHEMLSLAHKYEIPTLKSAIEADLCSDINPKNVLHRMMLAHIYELKELAKEADFYFYVEKNPEIFELAFKRMQQKGDIDDEKIASILESYRWM